MIEFHFEEGRTHARDLSGALLLSLEQSGSGKTSPSHQSETEQRQSKPGFYVSAQPDERSEPHGRDTTERAHHIDELRGNHFWIGLGVSVQQPKRDHQDNDAKKK